VPPAFHVERIAFFRSLQGNVEADMRPYLILILNLVNLLVFTDQDDGLSTFDAFLGAP
jgi:hypothetical protein